MPDSNQELARRALAAFSRGDLEECLAMLDPDVEWHIAFRLPDLPPDLTVAHGHAEVREVWDAFLGVWERLTVELEEILYDGNDLLLGKAHFHGIGAGSGAEVERTLYYLLRIRGGLLTMIRPFDDLGEARRAAGLPD